MIIKSLDPLRAKKSFIGKKLGHTMVSATKASPVTLKTLLFWICETKAQNSCAVTAQLISAFVIATLIVPSPFFLNPKFKASSHLLWLQSPVCVGPGRKPQNEA